jgi:hypothetical protein
VRWQDRTARRSCTLLTALALMLTLVPAASAGKPVYRTPGYPGISSVPAFSPAGPDTKPGKPVKLGGGYRPHLLVDAAGTAQIVFSTSGRAFGPPGEETTTAGADHYCRLPRGARACAATTTFVVPETYAAPPGDTSPFFDNQPGFNTDIGEGARPLASGNSLLVLMHRARNVIQVPGGYSDDANFLYSSDDGGRTFTGPGIVGTLDYQDGAVIYGSRIQSLGVLGTTPETLSTDFSHDYFQGTPAGAFGAASVIAQMAPTFGSGDGRSLALDGTRPVAAFNTISRVIVREYRGNGDVNDPRNWSQSSFPGTSATLAGGSHGAWLAYHPIGAFARSVVVRLVNGRRTGRPVGVFPPLLDSQDDQITENANGGLTAAWAAGTSDGGYRRLTISSSADGRHWSTPRVIARTGRHDEVDGLQIATAPDGGGFAMYVHGKLNDGNPLGAAFSIGGQIVAVPFGPAGPTGHPGLGGLGGGSGGSSGCLDVRFGAVHAHVDSGCFLQDPADPTGNASIAYGGVHVNGLELHPDTPQTAIVIDPRTHAIDSVHGDVSVLLQAPGVPDIKLWDGDLHAYLGSQDNAGDLLFALPMGGTNGDILGFHALGTVDVLLGPESVRIPMPLKLPSYLGATGQATLVADMAHDLARSSLHITVPDLELDGLEVSHLSIDYSGPGQRWAGTTELNVPPGSGGLGMDVKDAAVSFDHGDFASGSFATDPYPGTSIYRNTDLENFDASFDLHSPQQITGSAEMGEAPQGSDGYELEASGRYGIDFGSPSVMTVNGSGAIEGLPLTNAQATFRTDGHFSETGSIGIDGFGADLQGTVDATASLPDGALTGQITGSFSVFGKALASRTIPFSSDGFGVCEDSGVGPVAVSTGFFYRWSGGLDVSLVDCDSDVPASASSLSAARAAADGVQVVPGSDAEELTVHGAGGAPSIVVTTPNGHTLVPSTTDKASPVVLAFPDGDLTAVALRHPIAGLWHVDAAPGSVAITSISAARGYPAPNLQARVSGSGPTRTLIYSASLHPGLVVRFAERRGRRLLGVIGSARRAHGRIRFTPAAGPAGIRQVVALLAGAGTIPRTVSLARYRAAAQPGPGRASVRIRHVGRTFLVEIGRARGATAYAVRAVTAGGRRLRVVLRSRVRVLRVPAAGWSDSISVTVTPLTADGRAGRVTRAGLHVTFGAPRFRARRAHPAPRRRRH